MSVSVQMPRSTSVGLSVRAERAFEWVSSGFVLLLGAAWAVAIVGERGSGGRRDKVNPLTPATAAVVSELSAPAAPTAAYVTDAMNRAVARGLRADAGESGRLRARVVAPGPAAAIVRAAAATGTAITRIADFSVITPRAASDVRNGRIGLYYLGAWPARSTAKGGRVAYDPPSGFVEVTPGNQDTRLSDHFRLRDFLTHDQQSVWPKYVVINLRLVDKLELVLDDLRAHGINPDGVHVMSGFRTPHYNRAGGDPTGRASLSRHMYGDAADIYLDDDGDGRMDDLNHDGRVDLGDARVILGAVNRVERAHPELVGGCGVYAGNGVHGPFVHIDTRGYPARWVGTGDN